MTFEETKEEISKKIDETKESTKNKVRETQANIAEKKDNCSNGKSRK